MSKPRILLAAPTSKHKDYCFQEWASHVKMLTYDNFDVLIVDNTPDGGRYQQNVLSKKINSIHYDPPKGESTYLCITKSQNEIVKYARMYNYDYIFMLESDQFPPLNVIEYLLSFRKQVVSLPYFIGQSFASKVLYNDIEDFGKNRLSKTMSLDKAFMQWNGKLKRQFNHGIGCMLISKTVFKRFGFRMPVNNEIEAHSDVYFHEDLRNNGISSFVTEAYISHHENASWFNILNKM